jgi:hypothetical protein
MSTKADAATKATKRHAPDRDFEQRIASSDALMHSILSDTANCSRCKNICTEARALACCGKLICGKCYLFRHHFRRHVCVECTGDYASCLVRVPALDAFIYHAFPLEHTAATAALTALQDAEEADAAAEREEETEAERVRPTKTLRGN